MLTHGASLFLPHTYEYWGFFIPANPHNVRFGLLIWAGHAITIRAKRDHGCLHSRLLKYLNNNYLQDGVTIVFVYNRGCNIVQQGLRVRLPPERWLSEWVKGVLTNAILLTFVNY